MKKLLFAILTFGCIAPAQVLITSGEATSKEVVVNYLAPPGYTSSTSCNVKASYVNDFSGTYAPIIDVDATQFPGSDTDTSRITSTVDNRSRQVVIGKQIPYWRTLPASATTNFRESLGIKAATQVYVKITCGGSSDTVAVSTKTVPFGQLYAEPTPADPNAPGFANWPSIKWASTQTIIDPEYGTELKRPEAAGVRGVIQTAAGFQEAVGSSWTSVVNVLADDSSSASISASQAILVLPWPYTSLPVGSISQAAGDTVGLDWIKLTLKGTNSASTQAGGSVDSCLSIDTGVNCFGPWRTGDVRSCASGCSIPSSPQPGDHWQAAGDRPIPRQWLAQRSGTFTYVASTSTVTIVSGDSVGEKWTVGTQFRVSSSTSSKIRNITAGSPINVQTLTAHGLSTGDKVVIANANGSLGIATNGTWTVTVVDSTHITLNNSTGAGVFGRAVVVDAGTPGTPPVIHSPNSFFADGSLLALSGFTDSGWTSLNGNAYVGNWVGGSSESFTLTGASTTGTFTQVSGATVTQLGGTVQKVTDYGIASVIDATHVTLTSGPGADITTAANWSVSPLAFKIRKTNTSADTINLQYAQATTQLSAGNSWPAAGTEICAPYDAAGVGGKLGNLCTVGTSLMWIPHDGSVAQAFGLIPFEHAADIDNLGITMIGNTSRGSMGVNPNDPTLIYAGKYFRTGTSGFDQQVLIAKYEGDFTPRDPSETAASLLATYPTYGAGFPQPPYLPNCYGDGKYNDGVNPRIIPTRCISYKNVIPSIKAIIGPADTTHWPKYSSTIAQLPCAGGVGNMNFVYRPSTNSVWASISCVTYNDEGGPYYLFDLGNEKPVSDGTSTVRLAVQSDSWSQDGGRWSKYHGGLGLRDGYTIQTPHPQVVQSGVFNGIVYNQTCAQCGPFFVDYLSVDGVGGAPLTRSLGSCAAYAGSPYLPSPIPDGTADKGCNTVVVSGEPCDESPTSEESIIMGSNTSLHTSKCGTTGRYYLQDAVVGDIVVIDHDADRDYHNVEPAIIIAKTGNTWVLLRGVAKRPFGTNFTIDHTGDTKRLVMQFSYDYLSGGYPQYYRPYDPVGTVLVQKLTLGHGAIGETLTAGSTGSNYGVIRGSIVQRVGATQFDFAIPSRGFGFENKAANDVNSIDSHMTFIEAASNKNKDPFAIDAGPWNGYSGVAPTGPVSGTTTVYKWTAAQLNASIYTKQFPKFTSPEVRLGHWVARNIGGPSSSIDDFKPYTFCPAYVANECRSGSTAGDVFIAMPLFDQTSTIYQCCGNDFMRTREPAITSPSMPMSRYLQILLMNDQGGSLGRALTSLMHTPRAEDSFKNWSMTPTGLGVFRERGVEFVKSELFSVNMPPIVRDSVDRTKFWQQTLPIGRYAGADNVIVRFGYAHYGDVSAGNLFCTTRSENCVMAAGTTSSNPYYYESTDSYSGISCSSGCSATLPLIPNRVAYYQVVYRSGSTVLKAMPKLVIVSP
jgi:hypothetical protein